MDPPAQIEPNSPDSRPPSVASSDRDYEDYAGEVLEQLEGHFREEEDHLFDQDESALPGMPGLLFSTPATPAVKQPSTPMSPTLAFTRQSAFPSLISGHSLSPSVPPVKPHLHPLSPTRPVIPGPRTEYQMQVSPPHPHAMLPSRGASVAGQSARTSPARESPSHRFFALADQIEDLGRPTTWVHGRVISTLGDYFCYTSRLKPRHAHYEILPTDLFELWNSYKGGHTASRTCFSHHFKQAASPSKCRAWLVPVLIEHHWYLLGIDWIDGVVRIYDSIASSENHKYLFEFCTELLNFIAEDLKLNSYDWRLFPETVSSFHRSLIRF